MSGAGHSVAWVKGKHQTHPSLGAYAAELHGQTRSGTQAPRSDDLRGKVTKIPKKRTPTEDHDWWLLKTLFTAAALTRRTR